MKRLALTVLTVLVGVSLSQAAIVYDFDHLQKGKLHGAKDATVQWKAVSLVRNKVKIVADPAEPTNKFLQAESTLTEQLISRMRHGEDSLFDLTSQDTRLDISYTGKMSDLSGFMVGIWMDGGDWVPNNSLPWTILEELPLQFGVDASQRAWSVIGAGGTNAVSSSNVGLPTGLPELMTVTLSVDLLGNGGDGSATLTVVDQATGTTYTPYSGLSLGLLSNPEFANPESYTGWYVANNQVGRGRCGHDVYTATLDNLALEVVPEPASLCVLLSGGLAMLRPRPRRR